MTQKVLLSELEEMMSKLLDEKLKEATKPEKRKSLIDELGEAKLESVEKQGKFWKAYFERDKEALKAVTNPMQEGTDSLGGFLVPVETMAEVLRLVQEQSVAYQFARKVPQKSDIMTVPVKDSGPSVTYTNEANLKAGTGLTFKQVVLTLKKPACWVVLSQELIEDSIVDIVGYINEQIAEAFAQDLDDQAFNATGTPYMGIFADTTVNQVTMASGETAFTDLTADHLADMLSSVVSNALAGARYFMHRTIINIVRKLKDTTSGQYIWAGPVGGDPPTIWGYPYSLVEQMPALSDSGVSTNFVVYGNLKHLLIGTKNELRVRQSDEASVTIDGTLTSAFEANLRVIRAEARRSLAVGLGAALVRLRTAAS
jgi:HK97 family phage major capsid protein